MNKEFFDRAFEVLPSDCLQHRVDLAIVLGSGWGDALEKDREILRMSYADIPGMGATTVQGHGGEFLIYERSGKLIVAFCGRRHYYEGVGWEPICLPVEFARRLGVTKLLLTNAAGGINPALRPGDFVILRDHVNTVGFNPMIGPVEEGWGGRFPDMSEIYDKSLRDLLHDAAVRRGLRVMDGVYAFTTGPVYETPAEVHAYGHWGADVVGMSTVPEAIFAKSCGLHIAGLSLVTNFAAGISRVPLTHQEVIDTAEQAKPTMRSLIGDFIALT